LRAALLPGLKTGHGNAGNWVLDQALDIAQPATFLRADQGHGLADGARASGAPDPVNIILGHVRQLKVHHVR